MIVLISSATGLMSLPYYSLYGATKRYVNAFSESLRAEVPKHIDIVDVKPYLV